jgi:hypothetical protein
MKEFLFGTDYRAQKALFGGKVAANSRLYGFIESSSSESLKTFCGPVLQEKHFRKREKTMTCYSSRDRATF